MLLFLVQTWVFLALLEVVLSLLSDVEPLLRPICLQLICRCSNRHRPTAVKINIMPRLVKQHSDKVSLRFLDIKKNISLKIMKLLISTLKFKLNMKNHLNWISCVSQCPDSLSMCCAKKWLSVNLDNALTDSEVVWGVEGRAPAVVDLGNKDTLIARVQRVSGLTLNATLYNHAQFFVGRFLDFNFLKTLQI